LGGKRSEAALKYWQHLAVKTGRWFVEQQQLGAQYHGPSESNPPGLTAGQFPRATLRKYFKVDSLKGLGDAPALQFTAHITEPQAESQVLID
jgi:hypothetical protein